MIFVTVGTHEQPFDRLVKCIDDLKRDNVIQEEIIIQTGFSTYEPKYCKWSKLFSYLEMEKNIAESRIIITHGGPSSFIMPLQMGKTPIVVPRRNKFGEHVNDHQLDFCRVIAERMGTIILVEDINQIKEIYMSYEEIISNMSVGHKSNNEKFVKRFSALVEELVSSKS